MCNVADGDAETTPVLQRERRRIRQGKKQYREGGRERGRERERESRGKGRRSVKRRSPSIVREPSICI